MRAFTITAKQKPFRGLMVRMFGGHFGCPVGNEVVPLEERIDAHLRMAQDALEQRGLADDYHVQEILGERARADITADDARDVLAEIEDVGWYVDHLVLGSEDGVLHHRRDPETKTLLVLVAPAIPKGGELSYTTEEGKHLHVLKRASNGHMLCMLGPGASFVVLRKKCRSGWREMHVSWDGQSLRAEPVGADPKPHRQSSHRAQRQRVA